VGGGGVEIGRARRGWGLQMEVEEKGSERVARVVVPFKDTALAAADETNGGPV
jgi:hypothetical protein